MATEQGYWFVCTSFGEHWHLRALGAKAGATPLLTTFQSQSSVSPSADRKSACPLGLIICNRAAKLLATRSRTWDGLCRLSHLWPAGKDQH